MTEATWTDASGTTRKLPDLADNHLRNILFFMQRKAGRDAATDMMWGGPHAEGAPGHAIWKALVAEADRRGLKWTGLSSPQPGGDYGPKFAKEEEVV